MKRPLQIIKPQKTIKIPLQFIKKLDRISLAQYRQIDHLSRRQNFPQERQIFLPRQSSSPNIRKVTISVVQRQEFISLNKPRSDASLQKAPRIRFRATGAGFRQRKHNSIKQQKPTSKNDIIFCKSSATIKKNYKEQQAKNNYEAFLLQQHIIQEDIKLSIQSKTITKTPARILFGEKYKFKQQGQFNYQQKFTGQDFQLSQQPQSYSKIGFGVDSNLSEYDLQSLGDLQGQKFLHQLKNRQAFCPIFKDPCYQWLKVKVLDFDPKTNQAIILRLSLNDTKKVSRLSIRQSLDESSDGKYWRRINLAKKTRRICKEQQKYSRYIASRKQFFQMNQYIGIKFNQKYHNLIEISCFNTYYKQFIIYKEMALKPQKFESMGIKIRTYQPFTQSSIVPSFINYQSNKNQLASRHYSKFNKFPNTLYKLFDRINQQSCNCIETNFKIMKIQDLKELQCNFVKMVCVNISGKIREFLLSDIYGQLAFAFKSKVQEKRYIKLHNYIFKDLIIQNLYEDNVNKWISFLNSFLAWTKDTPAPIIKLYLMVSKTSKCIDIEPSIQKVKQSLIQPLKDLESLIENIPDILSQLLGGQPSRLKIKQSSIKNSYKHIQNVALHSFQQINRYCNRFISKLKYLEKFKYQKQSFTNKGKQSYQAYLEQLRNDMIQVNHSVIFRSGIFDVDASNLKESIKDAIVKYKNRLGKLIQKQVEQQIELMSGKFKQREQKLKEVPKDEEELVKMREYLNIDCQIFLQEANEHYQSCQSFYRMLQEYYIEINFTQFQKATQAIIKQYKFMQIINAKYTQLSQIQQDMLEAINNQRDMILKGLDDMGPQIAIISNYSSLAQLSQYYIFTSRTYHDLQNFQKQLSNINYREKVLGQEISIFPVISKLERQLKPYFDLWSNAFILVNLVQTIRTEPIFNLKFDELKQQISQFSKELQRLSSYYTAIKNPSALWVIEGLSQKVLFAQEKLWVVRSFTYEGMLKKQGIRKEVLSTIFSQKEIKFNDLTLDMLIQGNVDNYKDFVIANAEKAERIWKLQLKITGIVNEVKKLQFQFSKQLEVPFVQQKILLSLSCAVHEQLSIMESIKDLEQAAYIQKKVNNIYLKLATIQETLLSMINFQEIFFPQLRLIKIEDIAREMGKEMSTFMEVQRIWKSMCNHFMKDNQVWQAIETDSYKNRLQNLSKMMAQVDKKINQIIDKKRQSFPRLFFISNAKMRELLLDQKLLTSSTYMPYLFTGIKDFIEKGDKIRGVVGFDNEEISFKKNSPKTIVWEYLKFVEEQVGRIIQWQINYRSNKAQKYIFSKAIRIICEWTYFIQEALSNRDLKGLQYKLNKEIMQNSQNNTVESCIYNSHYLMLRDIISDLQRKYATDASNFQWKKSAKYYMTEGGGVQMKLLNFSLPFKQEYTGNTIRPLVCLSDQSTLQTINISWHMNTGLIVQRNAIQSIKDICGLTLRHHVEQTIGAQTQPHEILHILRGYFCSDIWMIITQSSKIAKNILEIIAQAAFEVHSVVQSGKSLFYMGGQPYNLPRAFKFNLFIGLNHIQHQEHGFILQKLQQSGLEGINTKFGVVFRNASLILPSESMICKFKLESICINEADVTNIMKLYSFLMQEVKLQWYCQTFSKLIDRLIPKILKNKENAFEIFVNQWKCSLSIEKIELMSDFIKNLKVKYHQLQLLSIIRSIGSNDERQSNKKRILLIGDNLSGKDYQIKQIFKGLNMELKESLQYNDKQKDRWQYISIHFYSKSIPLEQKLIVRASRTSFLDQADITSFIVFYNKNIINWREIAKNQCENSNLHPQIQSQAVRQLEILFNSFIKRKSETNIQAIHNSFTLSLFKFMNIFCKSIKIDSINIIQRVQFVYMLIYWQTLTFFPSQRLKASDFGSTCTKQPLNYYYDIQKSAWIQWTTLTMNYFTNNGDKITDLFLPTKETVSFIYFFTSMTLKTNIWIEAESSGIGLHKILKRTIDKCLLQFYKAHKDANFQGISSLVSHNIAIFKKQGKYFPKLGQKLIICIEDVNLPKTTQFNSFMSVLLNYSYQKDKKRLLANSTFICTNSDQYDINDAFIASSKNLVRLKLMSPSQESLHTIFNYYLQWFFGNTQNPFSKQVRSASMLIVQLSKLILDKSKNQYANIIKISHLMKIFEGLCQCSPKTVKSTQDIFQLWLYECRSVFNDVTFRAEGKNMLDQCVSDFVSTEQIYLGLNQVNIFKEVYHHQASIFLKLSSIKLQYSDTYRKVDRDYLHHHLTQQIEKINYKLFSHFPLIVFQNLLDQIIKIVRVFNIPNRHVLIYGGKRSGKTTLARIASFIYCEGDSDVISSVFGWKQYLAKSFTMIKNKDKQQSLIFRLQVQEQEEFMTTIEELLYLSHPQSLLFDKTSRFLQSIGISSTSSQQYKAFKSHISKFLHCCITLPSHDPCKIAKRYPYLFRKIQLLNIHESYLKSGPIEIAKASMGKYYDNYQFLENVNDILIDEGIQMNQGKFMKLSQFALSNYEKCINFVKRQQGQISNAIHKIRVTEHQKESLQIQLVKTNKILGKLIIKVQQLRKDYKQFQGQYQDKVKDYNDHYQECEIQRGKTDQIRKQVDFQLSKVLPMLKAAEEAMAKVTRDDINQLRSFPSPPLPAAKVVESLIFLFNESHLVKEKVLDGGQKVRDFWEYAKKMILNDKLLKRVEEFKPDTIKNLDKTIVTTLKQIIKKPQFVEQRVFKASIAAGNLSLWIKAILAVYDVMTVIQPKKKLLNEAEQALSIRQFHLKNELQELNKFHATLMQKKRHYEQKLQEKQKVVDRIHQLQHFIANGKEILELLYIRQQEWKDKSEIKLKNLLQYTKQQSIFSAVYFSFLSILQTSKKARIIQRIQKICKYKDHFKIKKYQYTSLSHYLQQIFKSIENLKANNIILPFTTNFYESLLWTHELISINEKVIMIHDQSYLFLNYLTHESTGKMYDFYPKLVDCLLVKSLQELLDLQMKSRINVDDEDQDEDKKQETTKEILILINIEHRPQFLRRIREIFRRYQQFQIIIIQNEETTQFTNMQQRQHTKINAIIHNTNDIKSHAIKEIFELPIEQLQQLNKNIAERHMANKLIDLLCETENIIMSEDQFDEWISLHKQQTDFHKSQQGFKKVGRLQQQKIQEIIHIFDEKKTINIPKMIELIRGHLSQYIQGIQKTLFTLSDWLKDRLTKFPESLIKVIATNYQNFNALAYYLLKFNKMEQLEKNRPKETKSKQSKQSQQSKILSLACEVIDPASLFHSLRQNSNAYICITDKYKLKKALDQCKQIEQRYKTQYLEQFLQREQFHYVYLISECGTFHAQELVELKPEEYQEVITHVEWQSEMNFKEAYHMERLHRRYDSLVAKEREYIRLNLFYRPFDGPKQRNE